MLLAVVLLLGQRVTCFIPSQKHFRKEVAVRAQGGKPKFRKSNFAKARDRKQREDRESRNEGADFRAGVTLGEEERLQKVIARAGLASRRGAEAFIEEGRVVVNGKVVKTLGEKVRVREDVILVDGNRLRMPDAKDKLWVVVNKPRSVLSTTMDQDMKGRETVVDMVPQAKDLRLLPVGRLERDMAGLMILTNDNGWIHPLTHPSFEHHRRYDVVVQGPVDEKGMESLRKGMELPPGVCNGGKLKPLHVQLVDVDPKGGMALLDVSVKESRLDLMEAIVTVLGCSLVSVKKTEFGPLRLKGLRKGGWRELTANEIGALKKSCQEVQKRDASFKRPVAVDEDGARARHTKYTKYRDRHSASAAGQAGERGEGGKQGRGSIGGRGERQGGRVVARG